MHKNVKNYLDVLSSLHAKASEDLFHFCFLLIEIDRSTRQLQDNISGDGSLCKGNPTAKKAS